MRIEPSEKVLRKLGQRIRQLREERDLRQEDFEDGGPLSITIRSLQGIEYGMANARFYTLYKIAKRLGVNVSDLADF